MKELMTSEEIRDIILELAKRLTVLCDEETEINKRMAFIRNQKVEIINKMHTITTGHVAEESISISELGFDNRTMGCLQRGGINTLAELANADRERLYRMRDLGIITYKKIVQRMHELGYMDFPRADD